MTKANEPLTSGLQEWSLDDEDGPARAAKPEEMDDMLASVVDRWAQERADVSPAAGAAGPRVDVEHPKRRRSVGLAGWSAAAGLLVGFVLAGSMAAALVALSRSSDAPASLPSPSEPAREQSVDEAIPPAHEVEEAPREDVEETTPSPEEPSGAVVPTQTPVERLAAANEARRRGRFGRAARLYRTLAASRGPEAYAASVAAASLYLEHLGRPRVALRSFRRALELEPNGPLDLTVREGLARSHRRLGQVNAERSALEALITRHPRSNAAVAAEVRLAAMERGE